MIRIKSLSCYSQLKTEGVGLYINKVFMFIFQEFSSLRLEMNAACEGWPSLIVLPTSDSDVSLALRAARTAGLPVRENVVKIPNAIEIFMNNSTKSACFEINIFDIFF